LSDEFIAVATKEINEELTGISQILSSCSNDSDLSANSTNLQKHTHKIKGLAPMMGKENLGDLAALYDKILKQIISGESVSGLFEIMRDSVSDMNKTMTETNYDLSPIIAKTNGILPDSK
jgi:HPt (histidine-containing phosphotransfer) domain-containing protein